MITSFFRYESWILSLCQICKLTLKWFAKRKKIESTYGKMWTILSGLSIGSLNTYVLFLQVPVYWKIFIIKLWRKYCMLIIEFRWVSNWVSHFPNWANEVFLISVCLMYRVQCAHRRAADNGISTTLNTYFMGHAFTPGHCESWKPRSYVTYCSNVNMGESQVTDFSRLTPPSGTHTKGVGGYIKLKAFTSAVCFIPWEDSCASRLQHFCGWG